MALTLTRNAVVQRALQTIQVLQEGETVSAADAQLGGQLIEEMIDNWNTQALTVLVQDRTVYDLVAGKGGPDDPYTIGPGGDFDTGAAARPVAIRNATLLLNTTSPYPVEIPLAIITDDMYAANAIKSITNAQPQSLYYQASVPLGEIQLWNVPNTAQNDLVLYTDRLTPQFSGADVAYICSPGYAKAFRLGAAAALVDAFNVPLDRAYSIIQKAAEAIADIKLQNVPMMDLAVDTGFLSDPHGTYVIQTDQNA